MFVRFALIGAVVLGLIGATVALAYHGWDGAAIAGVLAALAALAAPLLALVYKTDQQTQTLDKIDDRTNGGLDRRINRAVAAAVATHLRPAVAKGIGDRLDDVAQAVEQRLKPDEPDQHA